MYDYAVILTGILGGIVFALAGMFKALKEGEKADPVKFGTTAILGGAVGGIMGFSGIPFNEENFGQQIVLFGFMTAIIEPILKAVFRKPEPVVEGAKIVTSADPATAPFDPRRYPATYAGYLADGSLARGLKMTDESFLFITYDLPAEEHPKIRKQVDLAETAGLRHYTIWTSKGYYHIENGIPYGSGHI